MQSIELVVVGFVIVFFIAITFYVAGALSAQPQAQQAELNVMAQQILQRITTYSAYNLSQDVGVADPNAPGYLSDYAIDYLAMASAQLSGYPACYMNKTQSELASTVGSTVYLVGYGYVIPNLIQGTLNLTAIARNLFGNNYNRYDVEIQIKPLVRMAICPYVTVTVSGKSVTFKNTGSPICRQFYSAMGQSLTNGTVYIVARGSSANPSGNVIYTVYYCTIQQSSSNSKSASTCYPPYTTRTALAPLGSSPIGGYYYSYAVAQMPTYVSFTQIVGGSSPPSAALVIYAQKVDYPYSATFYVFNSTPVSLIYGAPFPGNTATRLYLIHDADYLQPGTTTPCDGRLANPSGNPPSGRSANGIRYITLYTSQGLVNYGSNITLNPSSQQVQPCGLCQNPSCTACWLDLPTDALLALVSVEANSNSVNIPKVALVPIPLFPAPPATDVDIKTWLRWGFSTAPQVYAASAWGVFNSLTTTYLVNVTVYEYPGPVR
ncbi:hypothetical protein TUZN_0589 [Thermoproteus uzoniensis 768-20]|uniref:Uncharacterized protein n=1 Tax=Thermoproteus uzoniensis (strain 768-20) TaxID=999630 RepID=F2L427_THEU7|nr:hypothetical protein [Thermoproteus uzoniensis]AEA12083.1 hypothetical protein TUZN_0589 [Thermoproteus uzoniensis 768-20]